MIAADGASQDRIRAMARPQRAAANAAGEETRARLVDAALATLAEVGIAGTSSRAIARRADVNQALVFYHFGSFEGLLAAAARADSERRAARYADRLAEVTTLPQLVEVARELHAIEREEGSVKVLAQLLAGASTTPELSNDLRAAFDPWIEPVQNAVARALESTPLGQLIPTREAAITITSLFVGIELVADLDDATGPEKLLEFLGALASLAAGILANLPKPS
jgi:AcrR family transcriptional regulator